MRYIDEILEAVRNHPYIPMVHKRVLINRIEPEPTREELDRARVDFYGSTCRASADGRCLVEGGGGTYCPPNACAPYGDLAALDSSPNAAGVDGGEE